MRRLFTLLTLSSRELGQNRADFTLTKVRFVALACSVLWMAGVVLQAQYRLEPTAPEQSVRIGEVERRVDVLESIRVGERLARIETLLEENAKSSETTRSTVLAISVPVGLLALEGLFRLATAMAAKAKN